MNETWNWMTRTAFAPLLLALLIPLEAQVFDFDDGTLTDSTGTHGLIPFNPFGTGMIPAPASGSIEPADGALVLSSTHFGNGTALSPQLLGAAVGPTRIGFFSPVPLLDFRVSIDILDFGERSTSDNPVNHILGGRLETPGLGTTSGWVTQLRLRDESLSFSMARLANEFPDVLADSSGAQFYFMGFDLLPFGIEGRQFRLTLEGRGEVITASVADLEDPENPFLSTSRIDPSPVAGLNGYVATRVLEVPEDSLAGIRLDNFTVSEPPAVSSDVPPLEIAKAYRLYWEAEPGEFVVERAGILDGAWVVPNNLVVREVEGGIEAFFYLDRVQQFFRLRRRN